MFFYAMFLADLIKFCCHTYPQNILHKIYLKWNKQVYFFPELFEKLILQQQIFVPQEATIFFKWLSDEAASRQEVMVSTKIQIRKLNSTSYT